MNELQAYIVGQNDGTNGILAELHKIECGHFSSPHWHDWFELEIFLDGTAVHTINDCGQAVSIGSAYLVTPKDFHSLFAKTDITVFSLKFNRSSVDESIIWGIYATENRCTELSESAIQNLLPLINGLLNIGSNEYAELLSKSYTEQLIIAVLKSLSGGESNRKSNAVQSCVCIINEEFRYNLTLDSVAARLFVSPNYLGMLFKEAVGCSFRKYLGKVRLEYACRLLRSTKLSVKEIAFQSGYASVQYFNFAFKNTFNVSPGEYRRKSV